MMRAQKYLIAAEKKWQNLWEMAGIFTASNGTEPSMSWPDWCLLPLAASYAIVSNGDNGPIMRMEAGRWIGILGGLIAWRPTQGVYQFDPDVATALVESEIVGDLPTESFKYLPEHGVYIDPAGVIPGVAGFWAYLEYDINTSEMELRIVVDPSKYEPSGYPGDLDALVNFVPVSLSPGKNLSFGLAESCRQAVENSVRFQDNRESISRLSDNAIAAHQGVLDAVYFPYISLILYLCAESPEVCGVRTRATAIPPRQPKPINGSKGKERLKNAQGEIWQTGFILGRSLRAARTESANQRPGPKPHIRRAHWHSYWCGTGAERTLRPRWLPPTVVAAHNETVLGPTIRTVDDHTR
jgi:hypothetical protein